MPINYPTSPDTTTAGGTLSATHADGIAEIIHALDIDNHALAIAALEAKVGTAASVPTNVGDVLTAGAGGDSSWTAPVGTLAVGSFPVSVGPLPKDDSGWSDGLIGPNARPAILGIPNAPTLTLMAIANKLNTPTAIASLKENPPVSLQTQITNAIAGGTGYCYVTPGYIYREAVTIGAAIALIGRGQVSLRGSDDWSIGGTLGCNWTNVSGIYHSSLSMPAFSTDATQGTPSNTYSQNHRNVLFVDGVGYQLVNSATPTAGQWAMGTTSGGDGGTTHAFIPINPAGHKIEVGTRASLITTTTNAALTLDGMDIRHAATSGVSGSYMVDVSSISTAKYSVLNCMVSWCHGFGLSLGGLTSPLVQDCIVHDCGSAGVLTTGNTNALFKRVVLFNNGSSIYGWDIFYSSGGIKNTAGTHTKYEGCVAFNNTQSGLWFDIQSNQSTMDSCVCWDNYPFNASNEISAFVTISNCVFFRTPNQAGGINNADLGFYNSTSRQCDIYGNLFMHAPYCVKLHWDVRGDAPPGNGNGIHFHDNKIIGRYHAADQGGVSDVALYWAEGTGGLAITAIAAGANPSITVTSTATLATGNIITISGVVGAVECNGDWAITVIDGTHFSIVLASHTGYVSGGVVTNTYSATNLTYNNQYGYPGVVSSNLWSYQEADTRWWKSVNPVQITTLAAWVAQLKLGAGQWNAAAVTQTGFPGNGNGEVYMPDADRVGYLLKFGLVP